MSARVWQWVRRGAALLLSARFWQWLHGAAVAFWVGLVFPGLMLWRNSVTFVIFASLWANVATHASAWQGTRAERKADPEDPT